jgi:hypothetical protein
MVICTCYEIVVNLNRQTYIRRALFFGRAAWDFILYARTFHSIRADNCGL